MPAKSKTTTPSRYQRYKSILDTAIAKDTFKLDEIKSTCPDEQPRYITRVVGELVDDGWLVCENSEEDEEEQLRYRWNTGRGEFPSEKWLDEKIYGTQVKGAPEQDRPRERLLTHGAENLRNAELIAILIRSGRPGESAVTGGEKVAKAFDGRLEELPYAGRAELKEVTIAVEKTAYCQIMAGIELGRRVAALSDVRITSKISSSGQAMDFCEKHFQRLASDSKQEEFHIVTLDTKNQVIDTHQITVGTLDASLVHPREVFRAAIKDAASSIILVHNHPSGDPTPSREDFAVTSRLTECGQTIGIDVLDHIVLGRGNSVSIRESQ